MAQRNLRICYRCMKEIPKEPCPYCGFERQYYGIPSHHLAPGTLLRGRYVLGISVGSGGFGITYLAKDLHLQMVVAVKELYIKKLCTRGSDGMVCVSSGNRAIFHENKRQFLKEARILAKFQGDSYAAMVTVREHFEERDTAYLVMDYLQGRTLRELVRERRRKLPELLELLDPVQKLLTEIHGVHLVHRDVSPDNILITEDGKVYLLDFGGAAELQKEEAGAVMSFKRGYTPPEQYVEGARLGPWTDVYAMAATILFAITGESPEGEPMEGSEREKLPESWKKILARGMEPEVARRYQSIAELWKELGKCCRSPGRWYYLTGGVLIAIVAVILLRTVILPQQKKEQWYEWETGTYALLPESDPEIHLGVWGGYGDDGCPVELLSGPVTDSDQFLVLPFEEGDFYATLTALHTGSILEWNAETNSLVQRENSSAAIKLRGKLLRKTGSGDLILNLQTEEEKWLVSAEDGALVLSDELPEDGWIFVRTEDSASTAHTPVYHLGDDVVPEEGIYSISSVLTGNYLTAQPSLMDEPPQVRLLPETADGEQCFAVGTMAEGGAVITAIQDRIGEFSVLHWDKDQRELSFLSPDAEQSEFYFRYGGKNTLLLQTADGQTLMADPNSDRMQFVFLEDSETNIPDACRFRLEKDMEAE